MQKRKELDKDRFRKDLGNIVQAYQEVARRLGIMPEETNISEVKFEKQHPSNSIKKIVNFQLQLLEKDVLDPQGKVVRH